MRSSKVCEKPRRWGGWGLTACSSVLGPEPTLRERQAPGIPPTWWGWGAASEAPPWTRPGRERSKQPLAGQIPAPYRAPQLCALHGCPTKPPLPLSCSECAPGAQQPPQTLNFPVCHGQGLKKALSTGWGEVNSETCRLAFPPPPSVSHAAMPCAVCRRTPSSAILFPAA